MGCGDDGVEVDVEVEVEVGRCFYGEPSTTI